MIETTELTTTLPWGEETAQVFGRFASEAESLQKRRSEALTRLKTTPMPNKNDEPWRRTDPTRIGKRKFQPWSPASGMAHIPDNRETVASAESFLSGNKVSLLRLKNGLLADSKLSDEHGRVTISGISGMEADNFSSLMTVPDDVDSPALSLYNLAYHFGGYAIAVPDNVATTVPVWINALTDSQGGAIFPHNLIHVGKNSAITVVVENDIFGNKTGWFNGMTRVVLEQNAQLNLICNNYGSANQLIYDHLNVQQSKDSRLNVVWADLTNGWSVMRRESMLIGTGAEAVMKGSHVGGADSFIDVRTVQDHDAPSTTSDMLYKAVLFDSSKSVYRGIINVSPDAVNANAYQLNRNLLMDAEARSDSNPCLEILVDEVRCTHGSSAGKVDKDALFYMTTRGIEPAVAKRMLIEGFLKDTASAINNQQLKAHYITQTVNRLMNVIEREIS